MCINLATKYSKLAKTGKNRPKCRVLYVRNYTVLKKLHHWQLWRLWLISAMNMNIEQNKDNENDQRQTLRYSWYGAKWQYKPTNTTNSCSGVHITDLVSPHLFCYCNSMLLFTPVLLVFRRKQGQQSPQIGCYPSLTDLFLPALFFVYESHHGKSITSAL